MAPMALRVGDQWSCSGTASGRPALPALGLNPCPPSIACDCLLYRYGDRIPHRATLGDCDPGFAIKGHPTRVAHEADRVSVEPGTRRSWLTSPPAPGPVRATGRREGAAETQP